MEDSQEAASEAEEAAVGRPLHINYLVTRSRSDSHVADTKFDSDDCSSLLIKCRRTHTVSRSFILSSRRLSLVPMDLYV